MSLVEVFEHIAEYIDPNSIFAFALTCTDARNIIQYLNIEIKTTCMSTVHSLERIKWAISMGAPAYDLSICAMRALASTEILQFFFDLGFSLDSLCDESAYAGNLAMLQWARAHECDWDANTCAYAAEGGNIDVLWWLRENGCPWNEDTCSAASIGGHLDILEWAHANGCPWDIYYIWECVARNGHLHVMKWLRKNNIHWYCDAYLYVAETGNIPMLQWMRENGCYMSSKFIMLRAASNGHLDLLKWEYAYSNVMYPEVLSYAREQGNLEMLEWAQPLIG